MTRKSKKLKKCLTFTILAGLLFSCQVEETFTNPDLVEKKGVIIHKKFDELIKETQFKTAFDKINQPKKGSSHKSGATSKTVMENRYGFTIADYPANIVSSHGITSYTFLITKDSIINNVFENLVVNLKENQEPKAFIYKFTSEISGHNITPNNSQGSINIVEIEYNPTQINNLIGGDCIILSNWECIYNPSTHGPDTAGCTGGYKETRVCTEGTSGGGGGSSGGYSGSVGGGTTTSPSNPIGGTGSTSQSVVIAPVKPTYTSVNLTTALSLDTNQQNWISSHGQIKKQLQQFLFADPFSTSNFTFALNAVNYLMANPNATFAQYQNWFSNTKEGLDDSYDDTFWNNPLTNFPQQTKPSYDDFFIGYPLHTDTRYDSPTNMYNAVGGQPLAIFNSSGNGNTCALRVSFALNESGVNIPNIPGKTFKGADNKYYFLGAANLLAWMKKTFGTPTGSNYLTGTQGGLNGVNFPTLLSGKKGIYCMIPNSTSGFGASGHIDILYPNTSCDGGCYFDAQIGGVKEIFIFELP